MGYLGIKSGVPADIEETGIVATSPEDCVVICDAQPVCLGVVVSNELFLGHPADQVERNNCFLMNTDIEYQKDLGSFANDTKPEHCIK